MPFARLVSCASELMFGPELATLSRLRKRRKTLIALESMTDFESWGACASTMACPSMSRLRGLDQNVIDRLLPPTPTTWHAASDRWRQQPGQPPISAGPD